MALREHRTVNFEKAFSRHKGVEAALLNLGFGITRADANELAELLQDTEFAGQVKPRCLNHVPAVHRANASTKLDEALEVLQQNAAKVEPISSLSEVERAAERLGEASCSQPPCPWCN